MNIYIILIILGLVSIYAGLKCTQKDELIYCEELGYSATLKQWKQYAKTLIDSKPIQKELDLMNVYLFMQEMKILNNWNMRII